MDAKLLRNYRAKAAKPVFTRELPKPRRKLDLLTAACAGLAIVSVAALAVAIIPIIT